MAKKKAKLTKHTIGPLPSAKGDAWKVLYGKLKRGKGNPGKHEHLFKVFGEKLPQAYLTRVKNHVKNSGLKSEGVYVVHDSMGCPRYIGRGSVFSRIGTRFKAQPLELRYFSFYLVSEKKHEREIETILIRASSYLLEFNEKKKKTGIAHGDVKDYEAGSYFYERQKKKGKKRKKKLVAKRKKSKQKKK